MPTDNETIYELTDVEVDTLGLVSRGANREEFFMLKSDTEEQPIDGEINKQHQTGSDEMQAPDIAQVEEKITKSVWQKLIDLFKRGNITIDEPAIESADTEKTQEVITEEKSVEKEVMPEVQKAEATMVSHMMPDMPMEDEEDKEDEEEMADGMMSNGMNKQSTTTEPVVEKNIEGDATMPEDVISKAEFEKAQAELVTIRKELEAAKEEKTKMVWLSKANEYGYAPVASTELAQHLYAISKLDNAEANWLVDLLKAYDAMLHDSGMFVEKGSSIAPVDAVEKALQAENPREALLNLDRKSAEEYLARMREVARR